MVKLGCVRFWDATTLNKLCVIINLQYTKSVHTVLSKVCGFRICDPLQCVRLGMPDKDRTVAIVQLYSVSYCN